jgi:hypothetical protein
MKHDDQAPTSITREQFRSDPKAAVERAVQCGRVIITDAQGRPVAAISSPMDQRPVSFD